MQWVQANDFSVLFFVHSAFIRVESVLIRGLSPYSLSLRLRRAELLSDFSMSIF